jgi:hypothetical protein
MTLEIQVLAWDRHKQVAGLNRLISAYILGITIEGNTEQASDTVGSCTRYNFI